MSGVVPPVADSPASGSPSGGDDFDQLYATYQATHQAPSQTPGRAPTALSPAGESSDDFDQLYAQYEAKHAEPGPFANEVADFINERATPSTAPSPLPPAPVTAPSAVPQAAARDETVTPATAAPISYARQLHGPAKLASDVFQTGAAQLEHPVETIAAITTALPKAYVTLIRFADQENRRTLAAENGQDPASVPTTISRKDAAVAAAQIATLGVGAADEAAARIASPFLGEIAKVSPAGMEVAGRLASIGYRAAQGAVVGAAFSPDHPAVGAILGGGLGGVTGGVEAPMRPRLVPNEPALTPESGRLLTDETRGKASGTARVVPEGQPGAPGTPAEPDFSVEMNTPEEALADHFAQQGTSIIEQLKAAQTERRTAERQANTDELTGLGNQRAFKQSLPPAEADPATAVVRFDLNGFKAVNDVVGHEAGDQALAHVATTIHQAAPGLPAFRVGGDEFALLVPKANAEAVRDAVEQAVGVTDLPGKDGQLARFSISGGVGNTNAEADQAAAERKALHKQQQGIGARGEPVQPTPTPAPTVLAPELEHLAKFFVTVSTPGMDDPSDLAVATAQIKALPKEQRDAVRARVKELFSAPPVVPEPAPVPTPVDHSTPQVGAANGQAAPTGPVATIKQAVASAPKQQPVVQPRSVPIAPNAAGHEGVVALSDGRELPVRYAIVPAASLVASHHPETFALNPDYPAGVQGRAYHGARGKAAREHVIQETQRLSPIKLLDLGSSVSGPPVITPDGYAIIGNQRTMMLQRAAAMLPDRYADYRDKLAQIAPRLGIDPAAITNTRAPVLVRVMDPTAVNTRDVATLADLNRVSDIADTKAKDAASEGASRAAALTQAPQVLEHLRETMDPQETISEYLNGAAGEQQNLSFRITPELKAKVEAEGQPLMERPQPYANEGAERDSRLLDTIRRDMGSPEAKRAIEDEMRRAQGSITRAKAAAATFQHAVAQVEQHAMTIGAGTPADREAFIRAYGRPAAFTITGADVSTPAQLRAALTVMRHPLAEHVSFIFKDAHGRAVDHFIYTSGANAVVRMDLPRVLDDVTARAKALGATSVVMAHNHPSGLVEPSLLDKVTTNNVGGQLEDRGVHLEGHMVIDHDKATWMTPKGQGDFEEQLIELPGVDQHPWRPSAESGQEKVGLYSIGRLVRQVAHPDVVTALYRDSAGRIAVAEPVDPTQSPEAILTHLDAQGAKLAVWDVIIAVPPSVYDAMVQQVRYDREDGMSRGHYVTDIVAIRQLSHDRLHTESALLDHAIGPIDNEARSRFVVANARPAERLTPATPVPAERSESRGSTGRAGDLRPGPGLRGGEGPLGELTGGFGTDLFGNPEEPSPEESQESLFGGAEGTAKSRSLAETEADARVRIARLRRELSLLDGKGRYGVGRATDRELARQASRRKQILAELVPPEKLVNRGNAIGADELKARSESGDLFGERQPGYGFDENGVLMEPGAGYGTPKGDGPIGSAANFTTEHEHPTPEPSGLSQHRRLMRPTELLPSAKHLLAPEAFDRNAKGTAGGLGHNLAVSARELAVAQEALREFGKAVGKLSKKDAVAYWDAAEQGKSTGNPTFDEGNRLLHQITAQYTKLLVGYGRLSADATIANYIGRFWTAPNRNHVVDFLRGIFAKRPFEGPKSYEKHRTLELMVDGLDAGLIPATYNYVDSQFAKIAEMQRVITSVRTLRQTEQPAGRAKIVLVGEQPPRDSEGHSWVRIGDGTDPAFTVYGSPEVHHWEAVDTMVYGKLQQLLEQLGVEHVRKVKIGHAGALGYAEGDKRVTTKFGGAEGTIMHEMGHILDERYGLGDRIDEAIGKAPRRTAQKGKKAGQSVPDYSKKGGDTKELRDRRKRLKEELRTLANYRRQSMEGVPTTKELGGQAGYLHSRPEKMANMVEAYIANRALFKRVAPGIFDIFDGIVSQHPELHALRDIEPSLSRETHNDITRITGLVIKGHWYAPRGSAAVWNNHLSRGLKGNPWIDAYMAPTQLASQLLLSFSGFHFTVIATEGVFSDLALAADNLANRGGSPGKAPMQLLKAAGAPVSLARLGRRVMQQYRTPGVHPDLEPILQEMMKGGFRGRATSELWTGERKEHLFKAIHDMLHGDTRLRQVWGASRVVPNAVYAAVEAVTMPLLGKYVPWMKTGATYMAVAQALSNLPPGADAEAAIARMRDIVHEMDYRFGQVEYDNHFMNNAVKHAAQLLFLAPGWTFGTVTLMARGARDVAALPLRAVRRAGGPALPVWNSTTKSWEAPKEESVPPEMIGRSAAYWAAAVLGTMLINGILTYLLTGQEPEGKDFFAFRDGTTDRDGNPNRHTIPGYLMHDVYGWSHHAVTTFTNKLAPTINYVGRFAENRNYFGDQIYDEHGPFGEKVKDVGVSVLKEFRPLSLQNYEEAGRRGERDMGEVVRNAFGVTPAKREFVRTPAQNLMRSYLDLKGHTARTPDEAEEAARRRAVTDSVRRGLAPRSRIQDMRAEGELSRQQARSTIRSLRDSSLEALYRQLTAEQKVKVYQEGQPWEQAIWARDYRRAEQQLRAKARLTAHHQ